MKKLLSGLLLAGMLAMPLQVNAVEKAYDIPMDAELQHFTILECEKAGIAPEFIFAVLEVETQYGDNGRIKNLMQIKEMFYKEEMKFLGIAEIETPENNIMLGIKIFHDLFDKYEDVAYVLMVWNGGKDYADTMLAKGVHETGFCKKVYEAQERLYAGK